MEVSMRGTIVVLAVALIGFGSLCMAAGPGAAAADETTTESICTAAARCENGKRIDCEGTDTCTSRDHTCPTANGWVRCDGVTYWCPDPCEGPIECPMAGQECTTDEECQVLGDPPCLFCMCPPWDGICICPE